LSSYSPTPLYLMLGLLIVCALFGGVFLAGLRRGRRHHEFRLRQLAERERVATGLHDTLLQSMQGMILRFQGVSHRLPEGSPERATIETILDQADEVLAEGRHQILALRMPVVYGDDLSQAFAAIGQSLEESFNTPFRLVVTARPVAVNGDLGEEIYGIVREALYNAFQHARAGHIELELVYGCEFLSLYVRDDGRGMAGTPRFGDGAGDAGGYRGLAGMRERAERMGGGIEVLSLPERGTEVILKVPGAICYQSPIGGRWRRLTAWLARTEVRD
jgi:signal transduction histidine kinase